MDLVAIAYPAVTPQRQTMRALVKSLGSKVGPRMLTAVKAQEAGDNATALKIYMRTMDLARLQGGRPNVVALYLTALVAHSANEHRHACDLMAECVDRAPGFVEAWYNLGTILAHVGDFVQAERCHRLALAICPAFGNVRTNLGNSLLGQGKTDEALAMFEAAMQHTPTDQEARWNRAHVLMLFNRWAEGWADYEARWRLPGFCALNGHPTNAPRWRGESLTGKKLGIHYEQGHGDMTQMLRFGPHLRTLGAQVVWCVQPELVRLARASVHSSETVRSAHLPAPAVDYWLCAMSLPHRLTLTPDALTGAPYLKAA